MKKNLKLLSIALAAASILSLTACGGSSVQAETAKKSLNIFVWTEYVPDSVIKGFEEKTGITVNVSTFSTNEDMLAKVKAESEGAYDIVQPSDYMVEQMINQGMLEKLDTTKLTNLGNIGKSYLKPSYDPTGEYSVPYLGGVGAIAVNTSKITDKITSYADLFNPKYKNSLVVLDDFRATIGMTAHSIGLSMNETDPDKLAQIKEKLLTLKDIVKLYDSDSPKSALITGDCSLGFCWSAEIALAMEENPDIQIVYPEEGAFLFLDNWCVPKGAKNYDAAMEFINYMLEAETSAKVSAEFPYLNPNTAAVALLGSDYINNPAKNPPSDVISKGEFVKNLDTATIAVYDEMWTALKK